MRLRLADGMARTKLRQGKESDSIPNHIEAGNERMAPMMVVSGRAV